MHSPPGKRYCQNKRKADKQQEFPCHQPQHLWYGGAQYLADTDLFGALLRCECGKTEQTQTGDYDRQDGKQSEQTGRLPIPGI